MVADCMNDVNKVKEEIASLRECQDNLDRRVRILEVRSPDPKWPLFVVLFGILAAGLAIVAQQFPLKSADKTMILNLTFNLHDSWLNYVLQQVSTSVCIVIT